MKTIQKLEHSFNYALSLTELKNIILETSPKLSVRYTSSPTPSQELDKSKKAWIFHNYVEIPTSVVSRLRENRNFLSHVFYLTQIALPGF